MKKSKARFVRELGELIAAYTGGPTGVKKMEYEKVDDDYEALTIFLNNGDIEDLNVVGDNLFKILEDVGDALHGMFL